MRRRVDAQRQTGNDADAGLRQLGGDFPRVRQAVGARPPRADHGDGEAIRQIRFAVNIEQVRRVGDLPKQRRILRVLAQDERHFLFRQAAKQARFIRKRVPQQRQPLFLKLRRVQPRLGQNRQRAPRRAQRRLPAAIAHARADQNRHRFGFKHGLVPPCRSFTLFFSVHCREFPAFRQVRLGKCGKKGAFPRKRPF